jgi:hypothetical protein
MAVHRSDVMYDGSAKGSAAYGLTTFAGIMLCVVAVFQIMEGIAAIAVDNIYVRGVDYTYELSVQGWGWIHLIVGLIALGTGFGVILGNVWGYVLGIVIASLSALMNFAFIPHYPFWSMILIAFDALVVWALCTQMTRSDDHVTD